MVQVKCTQHLATGRLITDACVSYLLCCPAVLWPCVQLESGTVDDELAALKKGMLTAGSSSNGPVAALPEGRPVKDAIDMELEALRKKARE